MIEILQATVEVDRIVAMSPEHVRLDEIDEDETLVQTAEEPLCHLDAIDVRLGRLRLVDVLPGEDVADLADAVDLLSSLSQQAQVVRPTRNEREVVAVRRAT